MHRRSTHIGPIVACVIAFVALIIIGLLPVSFALLDLTRAPGEAISAMSDSVLWSRLGTTGIIVIATLGIAVPIGMVQAWLLARTNIPLRRLLLMLTPLPLFLPPLVHVVSWFGLVPLRGIPAIVLVYVISFMPFIVLLAARALEQISREHAETMRVIGGRKLVFVDEMRQVTPSAMIGAALILVFLLSDFAVAHFLSSVGPNVTVYADTLYAHHQRGQSAGALAASLPGLVICLAFIIWALRERRKLGAAVGPRFDPAEPISLGALRYPLAVFAFTIIGIGTLLPLASLIYQTGSFETFREQASIASDRIQFTIQVGAIAATGMVVLGLPLAMMSLRRSREFTAESAEGAERKSLLSNLRVLRVLRGKSLRGWLDVLVFLPLAVPPLVFGIGLIRTWNHAPFDAIYVGMGLVVIAMIGRYLAFAYLPIGGAIERLDPAMMDAAKLAGGGPLSRFLHVQLPLIASPIIAAWCVSFCFTLRELDTLIMLRAGQQSLMYHLHANVVFAREDETAAIALILVMVTFTPLLIYLAAARRAIRFL
jgi:iron(III) transport system permease protein